METNANINASAPNEDMHKIKCNGCQSTAIYSDRYKCLQCVNYNLCGICFEEGVHSKQHSTGHAMAHFKIPNELFGQHVDESDVTLIKMNELLKGKKHKVDCAGCQRKIVGPRFNCEKCYNYALCSNCLEGRVVNNKHSLEHQMVLMDIEPFIKIDVSDIRLGDFISRGGFGRVYKATWISKNRQVACKITTVTSRNQGHEHVFKQELAAYAELSGIFILKTFGYGERQHHNGTKDFYLIMEYMPRGSLRNVIENPHEKVSLRRKLYMAYHIAIGMHKLHSHGIIHRDIRPDNILVSSNYTAKIGDMGVAKVFDPADQHTLAGCPQYMPPEFYGRRYNQSLDVFTFGLTLNHLFTEKIHHYDLRERQIELTAKSPIFSELIKRCVSKQPEERPVAAEILATIKKFKRATDKHIEENYPNYKNLTQESKNNIIIKFFDEYHTIEKKEVKPRYSPPPSPRSVKDLSHQHFVFTMEELDNLEKMKILHDAGDAIPSPFVKLLKYSHERHVEHKVNHHQVVIEIDENGHRRSRSSSVSREFHEVKDNLVQEHVEMMNQQMKNHLMPNRLPMPDGVRSRSRSRSPNPFPGMNLLSPRIGGDGDNDIRCRSPKSPLQRHQQLLDQMELLPSPMVKEMKLPNRPFN